ncbi:MAG: hypothetical protein AB8H47_21540 [Bacteroidia bacterium]
MLYSTIQAPKAWTRHLSVLLFVFTLLWGPLVLAQSPPVEAWFTPGEFESGDELTLHIDYGSMETPVDPATEISLTFAYEEFDITSQPTMDVTDSWFCEDGNCDASIEVFNETRELKVTISRTNGQAVGGFGRLGKGKGIIIEMDEVQMKKESQPIQLVSQALQNDILSSLNFSYDAQSQDLSILGVKAETLQEIVVIGINGEMIYKSEGNLKTKVILAPHQLYFIRIATTEGVWIKKFWLQ